MIKMRDMVQSIEGQKKILDNKELSKALGEVFIHNKEKEHT